MEKLLENIVATGMDPNYEIVMNGKLTGLTAAEALEECYKLRLYIYIK
jgi:hypothetical protein